MVKISTVSSQLKRNCSKIIYINIITVIKRHIECYFTFKLELQNKTYLYIETIWEENDFQKNLCNISLLRKTNINNESVYIFVIIETK